MSKLPYTSDAASPVKQIWKLNYLDWK